MHAILISSAKAESCQQGKRPDERHNPRDHVCPFPSVKPREPQLTIAVSKVERYFPKGFSSEQMESIILKLLENYYRKRQDYER